MYRSPLRIKMAAPLTKQILSTLKTVSCINGMKCVLPLAIPAAGVATRNHLEPQYREARRRKQFIGYKPSYDKAQKYEKMPMHEKRELLKSKGVVLDRQEFPYIDLSSSDSVNDPFKPPEGDGKFSMIPANVKDKLVMGANSMRHARKIKKYEEDFDKKLFPGIAESIFVETNETLCNVRSEDSKKKLHQLCTNKAFVDMVSQLDRLTLQWKMTESIEPPRIVKVTTFNMLEEHIYAQITVRFHTKQVVAIYDRFGRLMYGDPELENDVLEYIVFEKCLSNFYGKWRVHTKIHPPNAEKPSVIPTMKLLETDQTGTEQTEVSV